LEALWPEELRNAGEVGAVTKIETKTLLIMNDNMLGELSVRIFEGRADAPFVFCFSGFMGSPGHDYFFLARHLARCGYNVVVPDFFGRGDSSYFGDANAYQPKNTLIWMDRIISSFEKKKWAIIGSSWGGLMSVFYLNLAKKMPNALILNDVALSNSNNALSEEFREQVAEMCTVSFDNCEEAWEWSLEFLDRLGFQRNNDIDINYFRENYVFQSEGKFRFKIDPALFDVIKSARNSPYDIANHLQFKFPIAMLYGQDSWARDSQRLSVLKEKNKNVSVFDELKGGHPLQLFALEQRVIVQGFLDYAFTLGGDGEGVEETARYG
jgi:pimeloyl-ACP methyl ester carboxylesterase